MIRDDVRCSPTHLEGTTLRKGFSNHCEKYDMILDQIELNPHISLWARLAAVADRNIF